MCATSAPTSLPCSSPTYIPRAPIASTAAIVLALAAAQAGVAAADVRRGVGVPAAGFLAAAERAGECRPALGPVLSAAVRAAPATAATAMPDASRRVLSVPPPRSSLDVGARR